MEKLNKKSAEYGFQVKSAQNGIYMMPVLDGKVIEEDEFENLNFFRFRIIDTKCIHCHGFD